MSPQKQITVSPAASTPAKRKAERVWAKALKAVFAATLKNVIPDVVEAYREVMEEHRPAAAKLNKGIPDEIEYIIAKLDLSDWVKLAEDLSGSLTIATQDSGKRALTSLSITDEDIFNVVNEAAQAFAEDRAAELVGMRWDGEDLVPNPSARWAITESTRTGIRNLVVKALTDGLTVDELQSALEDSYLFSDLRAEMIARTELARAHVEGTLDGWKASGVVIGKRWILGSEHDFEDECNENEEQGTIGLNDSFTSGDDGPPAHPNCVCALVTNLKDEVDEGSKN